MREQLALLPGYLSAHLQLALVALLLGAAISIPLGIWIAAHPRARALVLGLASVIQTIPSLALLALMVPLLASLGNFTWRYFGISIGSIGYLPALIALLLYSMLPLLRNTVTGLAAVDPALSEAAMGVGMTPMQQLLRVELPTALPMIIAGARTACVWVVGMTVLSTPVGAPSLGNFIFTGLQTRNFDAVIVGCVSAALLALFLDWLIQSIEVGLQGRQRPRFIAALCCVAALYVFVLLTLWSPWRRDEREIRVGAKTFTEQYILAETVAAQLRHATGRPVRVVDGMGSNVVFDASKSGAIDVYVDYSGTVWSTLMKRDVGGVSAQQVQAEVLAYLQSEHIAVPAVLGFSNTYGLAMRRGMAREHHIQTLADLAAQAPRLRIASDYEFLGRSEWRGLQQGYGLHFAEQRSMDPALMYAAIVDDAVDVVTAYTSDGRLDAMDLTILQDPKGVIPPYEAMVLANSHLLAVPGATAALRQLNGKISLTTMRRMNNLVDGRGQSPHSVAQKFVGTLIP